MGSPFAIYGILVLFEVAIESVPEADLLATGLLPAFVAIFVQLSKAVRWNWLRLIFVGVTVVVAFQAVLTVPIFFGRAIYPRVTPEVGGGGPILTELLVQATGSEEEDRLFVGILNETDDFFYVIYYCFDSFDEDGRVFFDEAIS